MADSPPKIIISNAHIALLAGMLTLLGALYTGVRWVTQRDAAELSIRGDLAEIKQIQKEQASSLQDLTRSVDKLTLKIGE